MGLFSFKKKSKIDKTSSRNSAFYNRENHIVSMDNFVETIFHEAEEGSAHRKSNKRLVFGKMPIDEITEDRLLEVMDKSDFTIDNSENIPGHKVYFYRDTAGYYKFLFQFHFFNGEFFFLKNKISSSAAVVSAEDKTKVITQLTTKYAVEDRKDKDNYLIQIIDSHGNIAFTTDTVYFYISYLRGGEFMEKLKAKYAGYEPEPEEDEFGESLDKYL
jgi:hypothetical protein